jgi:hypothetical protein
MGTRKTSKTGIKRALLFGPFYYMYLGLWRQSVSYFAVYILFILLLLSLGLTEIANAAGTGLAIAYMTRAGTLYYRKVVLGQTRWL